MSKSFNEEAFILHSINCVHETLDMLNTTLRDKIYIFNMKCKQGQCGAAL